MSYRIGIFDFTSQSEIDFITSQLDGMIAALVREFPDTPENAYAYELVKIRPSISMKRLDAAVNFSSEKEAVMFAQKRGLRKQVVLSRRWNMDGVKPIYIDSCSSQRLAIADHLVNEVVKPDASAHVDVVRDFIGSRDMSAVSHFFCGKRRNELKLASQLNSDNYNEV